MENEAERKVEGQDECLSKSITRCTAADGIIFKGRCLLHTAHLASDGVVGLGHIYDGIDASGRLIVVLTNPIDGNDMWAPRYPQICEQGIYVNIVAVSDYLTVEYEPLSKKARYGPRDPG